MHFLNIFRYSDIDTIDGLRYSPVLAVARLNLVGDCPERDKRNLHHPANVEKCGIFHCFRLRPIFIDQLADAPFVSARRLNRYSAHIAIRQKGGRGVCDEIARERKLVGLCQTGFAKAQKRAVVVDSRICKTIFDDLHRFADGNIVGKSAGNAHGYGLVVGALRQQSSKPKCRDGCTDSANQYINGMTVQISEKKIRKFGFAAVDVPEERRCLFGGGGYN